MKRTPIRPSRKGLRARSPRRDVYEAELDAATPALLARRDALARLDSGAISVSHIVTALALAWVLFICYAADARGITGWIALGSAMLAGFAFTVLLAYAVWDEWHSQRSHRHKGTATPLVTGANRSGGSTRSPLSPPDGPSERPFGHGHVGRVTVIPDTVGELTHFYDARAEGWTA